MKDKNKSSKKKVIISTRLYPSQINELSMCCFVIRDEKLNDMLSFIVNNGGRVVAAIPSCGVSKHMILDSIGGYKYEMYTVFAMCQKEITDVLMSEVAKEFEFAKSGKGICFVVDILGYMGAKGPFVE